MVTTGRFREWRSDRGSYLYASGSTIIIVQDGKSVKIDLRPNEVEELFAGKSIQLADDSLLVFYKDNRGDPYSSGKTLDWNSADGQQELSVYLEDRSYTEAGEFLKLETRYSS